MNNCENVSREMTFEEEATLYEREARDMFSKKEGSGEDSGENNLIRRGMRIIRKSRETIASLQKFVDHIGTLSTCNDCVRSECEYKPRWGETVRYNCPLYLKLDTPNKE